MKLVRGQLELIPCFLEESSSDVFEQICALGDVRLPEVI